MSTEIPEKIVDRIRKLLALGQNNPSEHEAKLAMERAHRLLAEYNLSLADLPEDKRNKEDPYERAETECGIPQRAQFRSIAQYIGKLYFCKMFYTWKSNKDLYTFAGRSTNVQIAVAVTDSVLKSLATEMRVLSAGRSDASGFKTNFMDAAKRRIIERCVELIRQSSEGETKMEGGKNLPALRNTYLAEIKGAENFLAEQGIHLKRSASTARGSNCGSDGRAAGAEAGGRVSLRPGVAGTNRKALT